MPNLIVPTHSNIGPSGAHRWMNCAASVALCARLGLDAEESGEEAARGTVAHLVVSECLTNNQEAWEYAGNSYTEGRYIFTVDEEMVVACQMMIDLVHREMARFAGKNPILHIEWRVKSNCDEWAYGTSDCVIEVPGECIIVIDFKHGRVIVEPHDEQLKLYGEYSYECRSDSMRGDGEPTDTYLMICQPNGIHPKGPIRQCATTPDALTEWLQKEVVPAIAATRDPDATYHMGPWCKHCPALAHCQMWQETLIELPAHLADRAEVLTNEQITQYRSLKKIAIKFFEAVDKEAAVRVLTNGETIKGCKPVHKLGDRQWKSTMLMADPTDPEKFVEVNVIDAAAKAFGEGKVFPAPKIKSPAQMEKMTGGKAFTAQWAFKPTTGLTLADEDDAREPAVGLMVLADRADAAAAVAPPEV